MLASNLRTLTPCGACHLTVPESSVAPARSHLANSPNLIIPDACRGSGILLLWLWGRAVLSPCGAGVKPKNISAEGTNRIQVPEDCFLGAETQTQAQRQCQKSASLAQCKFLIRCTKKGLMYKSTSVRTENVVLATDETRISLSLSHLSLPCTGTCTGTTFFLRFFLCLFAWSTQHGHSMHSEDAAHVVLLFLLLLVKTAWPKHAVAE